jgi:hypothetical protein
MRHNRSSTVLKYLSGAVTYPPLSLSFLLLRLLIHPILWVSLVSGGYCYYDLCESQVLVVKTTRAALRPIYPLCHIRIVYDCMALFKASRFFLNQPTY